jgi:MFS transporter, DHA1 family, multidrug resistance protein
MIRPALLVVFASDLVLTTSMFMLVPIFPLHVTESLGLSAAAAGFVLAVRQFSQNVPTVLTGALADRFSHRDAMVVGLATRAAGFLGFGLAVDLVTLTISAIAIALGGSFFDAASRAAAARLVPTAERMKTFGSLSMTFVLGASIGPIVGVAALGQGFGFVCSLGALLQITAAMLIALLVPRSQGQIGAPAPVRQNLATVLADRAFLRFAILSSGLWLLGNVLYLALPLHVTRLTGTVETAGILFSIYALTVLLVQLPLSQFVGRRLSPRARVSLGLLCSSCGFLLIGIMATVPGLIACLLVIALGRMLTEPTYTEIVASLAPPQSLATYVGLGFVGLGLGGALGNLSAGVLFDLAERQQALWLPWLVYGLIGLALAVTFSRVSFLEPVRRAAAESVERESSRSR